MAGGNFANIGGAARNYIARLDGGTGAADAFDPNANGIVTAVAVQPNGKILAAGFFSGASSIGGAARNYIARLDDSNGAADAFHPNADGVVNSLAVQASGKILAGGNFTNIGGQPRNYIARLESATGAADAFNPGADNVVVSIATQSDGKVLAGGLFTNIGGQPRNRIARLTSTAVADSFDPNSDNVVASIAVQSDGKVLASGQFTHIGGQPRNRIARLDAATGAADAFDPNADNTVRSLAIQSDGKILAGGFFTNIGGQTRSVFARLSNDTAAFSTLSVTETSVTLTRDGSAPQFARVAFELSTDHGASYTFLGSGTPSVPARAEKNQGHSGFTPTAPQAAGYSLTGLESADHAETSSSALAVTIALASKPAPRPSKTRCRMLF